MLRSALRELLLSLYRCIAVLLQQIKIDRRNRIMRRTIFTPSQLQILDLMSQVKSEETLDEIKEMLSQYFARKAEEAIDKLWEEGKINEEVIEEWKNEHMRTPYSKS